MRPEDFQSLAVPGVCVLIAFLSYGPQLLFLKIEPGPLTSQQRLVFNALVAGIWICYARAVFTKPGQVSASWRPENNNEETDGTFVRQRNCRKCEALKPPRAHHCKVCKR